MRCGCMQYLLVAYPYHTKRSPKLLHGHCNPPHCLGESFKKSVHLLRVRLHKKHLDISSKTMKHSNAQSCHCSSSFTSQKTSEKTYYRIGFLCFVVISLDFRKILDNWLSNLRGSEKPPYQLRWVKKCSLRNLVVSCISTLILAYKLLSEKNCVMPLIPVLTESDVCRSLGCSAPDCNSLRCCLNF